MTHTGTCIWVVEFGIIGIDDHLSGLWCQAIIWNSADLSITSHTICHRNYINIKILIQGNVLEVNICGVTAIFAALVEHWTISIILKQAVLTLNVWGPS